MLIQEEAAFHNMIMDIHEDLIDGDVERLMSIVTVIRGPGRNKKNTAYSVKRNRCTQVAEHQPMWD